MSYEVSPLQAAQAVEHTIRQFASDESNEYATWAEPAFSCLARSVLCHYEAEGME